MSSTKGFFTSDNKHEWPKHEKALIPLHPRIVLYEHVLMKGVQLGTVSSCLLAFPIYKIARIPMIKTVSFGLQAGSLFGTFLYLIKLPLMNDAGLIDRTVRLSHREDHNFYDTMTALGLLLGAGTSTFFSLQKFPPLSSASVSAATFFLGSYIYYKRENILKM